MKRIFEKIFDFSIWLLIVVVIAWSGAKFLKRNAEKKHKTVFPAGTWKTFSVDSTGTLTVYRDSLEKFPITTDYFLYDSLGNVSIKADTIAYLQMPRVNR